jgi:hypothetical protein
MQRISPVSIVSGKGFNFGRKAGASKGATAEVSEGTRVD